MSSFNTEFYEIRPNQAVNDANWRGSIQTDWVTPNERRIDLSETMGHLQLEIIQKDSAGVTGPLRPTIIDGNISVPYLQPNYPLLYMESIYTSIKNKQVSETTDPGTAVSLIETCFFSPDELRSKDNLLLNEQIGKSESLCISNYITSAIVAVPASAAIAITATSTSATYPFKVTSGVYTAYGCMKSSFDAEEENGNVDVHPFVVCVTSTRGDSWSFLYPAITDGCTIVESTSATFKAITNLFSAIRSTDMDKRIQYALDHQGVFQKSTTQNIQFRLPTSLFQSKGFLAQDVSLSIRFNIRSNAHREMIGCVNKCPTILGSTFVGTQPNDSILIKVKDFKIVCRAETMPNIVSSYKLPLIQMNTFYKTIDSKNNNFTFNMPQQHINYLIMCFLPTARNDTPKFSSTVFSSPYSDASIEDKVDTDACTNIKSIRVQYAGSIKPSPDYQINFVDETLEQQNTQPYKEFVSLIESRIDRSSCYSYDKWRNAPIFIYKFGRNITQDNQILVNVMLHGGYTDGSNQLFITALYNEDLTFQYDSNGKLQDVNLTYE